jgi:hypothetical protein
MSSPVGNKGSCGPLHDPHAITMLAAAAHLPQQFVQYGAFAAPPVQRRPLPGPGRAQQICHARLPGTKIGIDGDLGLHCH